MKRHELLVCVVLTGLSMAVASAPVEASWISGRLTYEKRASLTSGLALPQDQPVAEMPFEIKRVSDGAYLGAGTLDTNGNFNAEIATVGVVELKIVIYLSNSNSPYDYKVRPFESDDPYCVEKSLGVVNTYAGGYLGYVRFTRGPAPYTSADWVACRALNIAMCAQIAQRFNYDVLCFGFGGQLSFLWTDGKNTQTQYGDREIDLTGQYSTDDDADDDAVIGHEMGHWVLDVWSKDNSPGGDHTPNMLLTYSEGWATGFGQGALRSGWYADTKGSGNFGGGDNIEVLTWRGCHQEGAIAAVFYDLFDDPSWEGSVTEDFDTLSESQQQAAWLTSEVLFHYCRHQPDMVTMADFLEGWKVTSQPYLTQMLDIADHYEVDDRFEPNNDFSNAAVLWMDGTRNLGPLYTTDQPDWYRFTVNRSNSCYVVVDIYSHGGHSAANLDLFVYLLPNVSSPIASSQTVSSLETVHLDAVAGQQYAFLVRENAAWDTGDRNAACWTDNGWGCYNLTIAPALEQITVDGPGLAGEIAASGCVRVYQFTINTTSNIFAEVTNAWGGTLTDSILTVKDTNGVVIATRDDQGDGLMSRFIQTLSAGSYQLEVSGKNGATGTYTIAVSTDTPMANGLPVPGIINGSRSMDWFNFGVNSDGYYVINTTAGTLTDTHLSLYGVSIDEPIESDDDDGVERMSFIERWLPAGTYVIKVRAYSADATGTYGLVVAPMTPLDIDGGGGQGDISQDQDEDWFKFENGSADARIIEITDAWWGSLGDSVATLFRMGTYGLEEVESDDDDGDWRMSRIWCAPLLNPGTYYVRVEGYGGRYTGTYTIAVSTLTTVTTGLAHGDIPYDAAIDWYQFDVGVAGNYCIDTAPETLFGTYMTLYDSNHNEPVAEDDNGNGYMARIQYYLTPGTYYAKVRADDPRDTGTYWFSVALVERAVTFDECTVSPNPVSPRGSVSLLGASGLVKGLSDSDWIKVVMGFRDANGNWAGGEPVVVYSGMPGVAWQPWSAGSVNITAPMAEGTYWVWVRLVATTDDATAVSAFKTSIVASEDRENNACGTVNVRHSRAWTLMVYMNGDSEGETWALSDFVDMASVGSSNDVNVVVMLDRTPGYVIEYGDWPNTRRGLVHQGDVPDTSWGQNMDEVNMGDPQTLVNFAQWTASYFPAQRYALILWDHDCGSFWDVLHDCTSNDTLSVNELGIALTAIEEMRLNLELIGLDTNGMSLAEVAYALRAHAQVMVASEEPTHDSGWPWGSILSHLAANPSMSSADLATDIVDAYYESYAGSCGCAAVSLPMMGGLAEQVDWLARGMMAHWSDDRAAVKQAAQDVKNYLLATLLAQHPGGQWPDSFGLAIYFPETYSALDPAYGPAMVPFAADTRWDEFLMVFYEVMRGSWIARCRTMALNFDYPQHADLGHFCDEIINYTDPEQYYVESSIPNGFLGVGSPQGWQEDDASWQYTLPIQFPFFGENRTTVWVCSNGFLDFASSEPDYPGSAGELITEQRIAAYWVDIHPSEVYIHQPTRGSVCIRWQAVIVGTGNPVNVEVILYDDGRIQFNYGAGNSTEPPKLPTIGIARGNAVDFYLAACNGQPSLGNANSVLWTPLGQREVTFTACSISPNPAPPGQSISLSGTAGEVRGGAVEETDTIVIGFRDRSGNWVGGEPVVLSRIVPGVGWQAWWGERPATIAAPVTPGTCWVWVKVVPTADNAAAIKSFKEGTPTADDAVNKKWATALMVQSAPAAPGNFTHAANAIGSITWAWQDNSDNEIGFRVDPSGGTVGQDVQSWTEPGLATNTAYTRHAHAYNGSGDSLPSNDHTAYTSIETCSGVTFGAVTTSSIQASSTNTPTGLSRGSSGLILRNKTKPADSGWKQDNTPWTSGSLLGNKAYQFTAQSRNGDAETAAETAAATRYTLPVAPNVTCNRSAGTAYPQGIVFTFDNAAGWADGGVNHYHYVFDSTAATTPTPSSSAWSSGSLAQTPAVGSWYLHLMSHNAEHASGGVAHLGPYVIGYTLTVVNGTGSGTYAANTVVPIVATVPPGYRFDKWTGDTANVANVSADSTTITMRANATVTATFVQIAKQFILTVVNGTGSGTYDSNAVVPIVASVPLGYHFHNWSGDTANVANVDAASTTITMLANAVVTATFGLDGDVNDDSCVNVADLLIVRNNLGRSGSSIFPPRADVNADGICNVADLLLVRNRLGQGTCR